MESPKFRNKISLSAGMTNQGLRDILTPTQGGVRIESVSEFESPLHNTKIVIVIEKDENGVPILEALQERRTIHYNRVDISTILPADATLQSTTITALINELNIKYRCDFTEDDLELVDGVLKAKTTSLGYYGIMTAKEPDLCALAKPSVRFYPRIPYYDANDDEYKYNLKIDGVLVTSPDVLMNSDNTLTDYVNNLLDGDVDSDAGPEGNEYQEYTNTSQRCIRFEIIPLTPIAVEDLPVEITGNQSFEITASGSILFNLSPYVSTCSLQYAKEVLLKPKSYDFKTSKNLCLFYKMTYENGVVENGYVNSLVEDLYGYDNYFVPNHPMLTVPNLIDSEYPSLSGFFSGIENAFTDRFNIPWWTPYVKQIAPVKRVAYLGCYRNASVSWGTPMKVLISEIRVIDHVIGNVVETQLGVFNFTASNINDAMTKIIAFYKPIFESMGYTVETYSIPDGFTMTNTGFKLTKISTDANHFLQIKYSDTTNILQPGWGDFNGYNCHFVESEVMGALITEEDLIDGVKLGIRPMEVSIVPSVDVFAETTRLELITEVDYLAAGGEPTDLEDVYDWIKENHNGQTLIIDSCARYEQGPM